MNMFLILPLLSLIVCLASADKTDSQFLDALNKGQRSASKNDTLTQEDRDRQRKIREEFLRDEEYRDQLIREDAIKREKELQQKKQEQRADVGTAGAANALNAPSPFQQQNYLPAQQTPTQQPGSLDPLKILSSGIFGDLLAPKILGQSEASSQLIPKLVTPNLMQNMQGQQQGQNRLQPGAAQPAMGFGGVPQTAAQPGIYNPYGMQQQAFPGFGQQALPGFGSFAQPGLGGLQGLGGYPQTSMMQPTQQLGMSPSMLGGSFLPQQGLSFTG